MVLGPGLGSTKDAHKRDLRRISDEESIIIIAIDLDSQGASLGSDLNTERNVSTFLGVIGDFSKRLPFMKKVGVIPVGDSYSGYVITRAGLRYEEEKRYLIEIPEAREGAAAYLSVPWHDSILLFTPYSLEIAAAKHRSLLQVKRRLSEGGLYPASFVVSALGQVLSQYLSKSPVSMKVHSALCKIDEYIRKYVNGDSRWSRGYEWAYSKVVSVKDAAKRIIEYPIQAMIDEIEKKPISKSMFAPILSHLLTLFCIRNVRVTVDEPAMEKKMAYYAKLVRKEETRRYRNNLRNRIISVIKRTDNEQILQKLRNAFERIPTMTPRKFDYDEAKMFIVTLRLRNLETLPNEILGQTLKPYLLRYEKEFGRRISMLIVGKRDKTCGMVDALGHPIREAEDTYRELAGDRLALVDSDHNPKTRKERNAIRREFVRAIRNIKEKVSLALAAEGTSMDTAGQAVVKTESERGLLIEAPIIKPNGDEPTDSSVDMRTETQSNVQPSNGKDSVGETQNEPKVVPPTAAQTPQ
jgi:pimeloyl-ACP methyl ester carboxylesterase